MGKLTARGLTLCVVCWLFAHSATANTPADTLLHDRVVSVAEALGLTDDEVAPDERKASPDFQVADTSLPAGWLPTRSHQLLNDYSGILTAQEANHINSRLLACYDTTRVEIAILIVPDLGGDEIAHFSQRVWDTWRIGDHEKDNGLLLVIKPKNSSSGEVRIQTGYGLEAVLPDIFCGQIIDNEMIPAFRTGEYGKGIEEALDVIIPVVAGEYSYDAYSHDNSLSLTPLIFALIIIVLVIWLTTFHSGGNGTSTFTGGTRNSNTFGGPFWGSPGSNWGDFGGSGGGFGGFGGFGGGSSGGGGASGRW